MIKGSVTAKPQAFAAAVKWAAKFVTTKPTVPMQGGILLRITDHGLVIGAYGENVTAKAIMPIEGSGEGEAVVSGRLLAALAGTFPDKPVEIGGDDKHVTLAVGRWSGTMPLLGEGEWPGDATVPEATGSVDGSAFADLIARVSVAAGDNEKQSLAMQCMHLAFDETSVTATATDGYRVARSSIGHTGETSNALVLASVMRDVAEAFAGPDPIKVAVRDNLLALTSPTRQISMRQMGEKYDLTAIGKVLELSHPATAVVRVADLLAPLKRAVLMRSKNEIAIGISFGAEGLTVTAKASELDQVGAEEVEATYDGADYATAFNPDYLSDALGSAPGDTVEIGVLPVEAGKRPSAVTMRVPGNDVWRHLLMPIVLRG